MRIRIRDISDSGTVLDIQWGEGKPLPLLPHEEAYEMELPHPLGIHIELYKRPDHVHIIGSVKGAIRLFCDRCLQPIEWILDEKIDTVLVNQKYAPTEEETELEEDDLNYEFYDGEAIDVERLIAEQVFLTLPLKVLCSPACRGLCPICGTNLNYQDCGCVRDRKNPSFAALESLKAHLPKKKGS
jgi:uncharacterized protein